MSDYSHLLSAYRQYASLSDSERINWIRSDRWLDLDLARRALARLEDFIEYPARDRMPCLLIYGDTGMGKTKIVRKFIRQHPPSFDQGSGTTQMPVVAIQMPPEPVEGDVYAEILTAIGAPGPNASPFRRQKELCLRLLRDMGTRMLILDEIHNMLAGTVRQQRVFLNSIRFLANDLRIPLVCVGTELARRALLTDVQLAERFEALHLAHWKNDVHLAQLLASLGSLYPLRKPSALTTTTIRKCVMDASDGVTVRIFRLLETLAVDAIRTGDECITAASFKKEGLVLPLVSMTKKMGSRLQRADV